MYNNDYTTNETNPGSVGTPEACIELVRTECPTSKIATWVQRVIVGVNITTVQSRKSSPPARAVIWRASWHKITLFLKTTFTYTLEKYRHVLGRRCGESSK